MSLMYRERKMPGPRPNIGDDRFFEGCRNGTLLIKKCGDCGEVHYYPRPLCPFCLSENTEWLQARGTGTIYTFSITRRGGPVPYAIAYVMLDEQVAMMTNIVDCDLESIRIGQKVRVVFKPTENDIPAPCFTPSE